MDLEETVSFRAQKTAQRFSNKPEVQHQRPAPPDRGPVNVLGYDPVIDVACSVVKVPYGAVYVGAWGSDTRSHEVVENAPAPLGPARRKDIFIPASQLYQERVARREAAGKRTGHHSPGRGERTWTEGEGVD
jgi:hypothetical protein